MVRPGRPGRQRTGFADVFPYAAEMALAFTHEGDLGPCGSDGEFEFALNFLLDGLRRLRNPD